MERTRKTERKRSEKDRRLLEEGWDDIGKSIAKTIVETGKSVKWGWDLIGLLGLYKRWMLTEWIKRYELENPRKIPDGRTKTLEDLREKLKQEIRKTADQERQARYDNKN